MARQARKRSATGIYHIMLRGIDKRNIFLDDEDRKIFVEKIKRAKEKANFELYAFCLMDNHIHLLIKESEDIGTIIKRITVGYVGWHNNKYGRTGHLFQNRFNSEAVESELYLLTVLRYIHQNPLKARIVDKVEAYDWSSYKEYELAYKKKESIIDARVVKHYFKTIRDLNTYINEKNNDQCMDYYDKIKYTDKQLKEKLDQEGIIENIKKASNIEIRNQMIKEAYLELGVSMRQLGRVLGLSKSIVEKATK
ncbi:REP element-mobilizing transposase RayT [Natranaerovirga hydrolytica]|uniref:REP element-mobilizing transposase RayT n=1 Tax=Natranaerovirga hydrolytica TaxID=680378 RepID=A0A4R1MJH0_9FIRM|nr:transposase [Natranaerovirga hydrolytica]TCK92585.1 REP element-mobilizing transposase RayT [Natranaerovirga hydrolytica]